MLSLQNGNSYEIQRKKDGLKAIRSMRDCAISAKLNGTSEMTLEEINEEITNARRERYLV